MAFHSVAVVVSAAEAVPALKRWLPADAPVAVFADSEALRALEAIQTSPPTFLLLDRGFTMTPRGAALVASVKDSPALAHTEVRVMGRSDVRLDEPAAVSHMAELLRASRRLDESGTRAAARYTLGLSVAALLNGCPTELADLSTVGAQVVTAVRVVPDQPVRLLISDQRVRTLCSGAIAWSSVATPGRMVMYRAGVRFNEADAQAVQSLCSKYGRRL